MTWFRMDDTLAAHPKARKAGLPAMGLWAVAGSWSSQQLTQGWVPDWYAETWPKGRQLGARLVVARLWHRGFKAAVDCGCVPNPDQVPDDPENGWQYHDWTQANPTADQEKERKAKDRERQKRARERAASARDSRRDNHPDVTRDVTRDTGRTSDLSHTVSHGPPDPTRPDPTVSPTERHPLVTSGGSDTRADARASNAPLPHHEDGPPLCRRHIGMDRDLVPACPACARLREQWETQRADAHRPPPRPPWCGDCDEHTRLTETDTGMARCPRCHPLAHELAGALA